MAQLDRLLAVMPADRTGVLNLEEGSPARVELGGGGVPRAVTKLPLTATQVVALIREVAPADAVQRIEKGSATYFTFASETGSYSARAEVHDGRWKVRINSNELPMLTLVTETISPSQTPLSSEARIPVRDNAPRLSALERIEELLRITVARGASDLHLRAGEPPLLRLQGEITRLENTPRLRADDTAALIDATMSRETRAEFAAANDSDYAYEILECARFRANAFRDRAGVSAVFRRISSTIVTADELELTPEIQRLASLTRGLVLVTGPTGSGKSTTLSAMIDLVNRSRADHIVTVEDPIEFVHHSNRCIVSQREVGLHTQSFTAALHAALREDPDVVLIGEMRDLETVSLALETAETGHLVFAALHTATATATIDRIIDQFPAGQQEQARVMLADSLRAIVSQTLVKRTAGGRIAAREVLFNTPPVSALIRERKTTQLRELIQASRSLGMVTMNDALLELVECGQITVEQAAPHAADRAGFLAAARAKGYDLSFDAELGPRRSAGVVSAA